MKNTDGWLVGKGVTLVRTGTARASLGERGPIDLTLSVAGDARGVRRTMVTLDYDADTGVEWNATRHDGRESCGRTEIASPPPDHVR